ncbi:U2 small nuclear ribonucleoprotein auxiliary factor 35 kDa subunit-related protein 1 isoform 2-T2 [Polymixia lowei]
MSQKQRKAILKKERRKRKRQAIAQARECGVKYGENHISQEEEEPEEDDENAQKQRERLHEEWLERERLAQEEFNLRFEREEAARKRKEEEERKIKEEWEAQQSKEQEEKEQKQQERRDREEAVQKMLDQAESQLGNSGPWMNPEAPLTENYGTERDIANCPFFLKTGACRFGDRCSRKHVHPTASPTLMIRGMFVTFGMEQCRRDDYDTDACLEHSEEELHEHFLEFYHDVLPEFKSVGKVVQFKVSCNFEPHLRGNVYIQFDTEEQCTDAFVKFNGRWYAGRQLHCELCPVTRWKNAICGLFDRRKCPKGKHCNFLHVFRNPGNEFWEADRDLHLSPDRGGEGTHRAGWYSDRCGERSWRQRQGSRSPPRSERSHSRRGGERRRSRSRSRESRDSRASYRQRGDSIRSDNRSSRPRLVSSRKDRYRSRSRERERDRSRSRERERDRSRSRSRERGRTRLWNSRDKDREGNKYRSRSRERDRPEGRNGDNDEDTETGPGVERDRDRSRSRSRDRERRRQSREKSNNPSPKNMDRRDKTPDNTLTPRHRKHSKKSKKKSKKRKKKKSHLPEITTSSEESEKEEEMEEERGEKNLSATSPSEGVNGAELVQSAGEDLGLNPSVEPHDDTENKSIPVGTSQKAPHEISSNLEGNGDISTF